MAKDKCPDILGICETFFNPDYMDNQVATDGYNFISKDRADTKGSLFVLQFYGPVNPMGSCRARSVYLTKCLLRRLSPLG